MAENTPAQLEVFLKGKGVNPDVFKGKLDNLFPIEIVSSIREYCRNLQQLLPISESDELQVRRYHYPILFRNYHRRHDKFRDFINKAALSYPKIGLVRGDGAIETNKGISDLSSRLAQRTKILLQVTFFYHTQARQQDHWAVIPLGRQRAFGMLVPRRLFHNVFGISAEEMNDIYSQSGSGRGRLEAALAGLNKSFDLKIYGADWSLENTSRFVVRIINHLVEKNSRAMVLRGFVMGDLLIEMLLNHGHAQLVSKLHNILEEIDKNDESQFPMLPTWLNRGRESRPADEEQTGRTIGLFDLGQIDNVAYGILGDPEERDLEAGDYRNEYYVFIIKHGIEVPTGIGFSLPLLPFLFRKQRWEGGSGAGSYLFEELRRQAVRAYVWDGERSYIDDFLRIGVDLTALEHEYQIGDQSLLRAVVTPLNSQRKRLS